MNYRVVPIELKLRGRFAVAGASIETKKNFIFSIDGGCGGEAAGSVRYGAGTDRIQADLTAIAEYGNRQTGDFPVFLHRHQDRFCPPALCAASAAYHELVSRQKHIPLWRHMELPCPSAAETSVTVSLGDTGAIRRLAEQGFRIIKVKMDKDDRLAGEVIEAIANSVDTTFRLDANESWTLDFARRVIERLPVEKVQLLEQPFPSDAINDWMALKKISPIPLFMDESICTAQDIEKVRTYVDGVNIKLQKSGLLETAIEAMQTAGRLGLKVMLGCMVESSVGIAVGYHLSGLADYLDLDGRWLLEDDPFQGLEYRGGMICISGTTGHGVAWK